MSAIKLTFEELVNAAPANVLMPLSKVSSPHFGFQNSLAKGRGMEFDEVRPYAPGDDVRNIDWYITARSGKPHTKLFREERDRCAYIVTDLSETMFFGSLGQLKARVAAILTASVAWQANKNHDKVASILIAGDEIIRTTPGTRHKDVLDIIRNVYESYQKGLRLPKSTRTIQDALDALSRNIRPGSLIYVISDFYRLSPRAAVILRFFNLNHIVFCYQIFDQMEIELKNPGMLYADNGNSVGYIICPDKKFTDDYRKIGMHRMRILSTQLKHSCQRLVRIDASKQ
ncbi:MAG: DUF58 domain-containing protein [Succinivibrionaceae bacterium]